MKYCAVVVDPVCFVFTRSIYLPPQLDMAQAIFETMMSTSILRKIYDDILDEILLEDAIDVSMISRRITSTATQLHENITPVLVIMDER